MTITIYGRPGSRARRPLWVARELGLDVENIEPAPGAIKQPDYLAINPNGKVPALVEDGFTLFESFAQSLYLAKKFGLGKLYPEDAQAEAQVWQWTFWGLNELEKHLTTCLFERVIKPEDQRDAAAADAAEAALAGPLAVLDATLSGRTWLLGEDFSVADINLAAIAALSTPTRVSLSANPNVARWLAAAVARPGYNG
ncbi:glutathione S-transferase family protein [Sphingomonas sp. HITSZ_GF]|uniref:glutathione S-transferase family protein n=1 Tax=Sphingomonas sp. HITSZ_GF TaxID=3037247 RepID=UPI00240E2B8B|nr:glutathione S-transferase family protein [Sphingomonas sp. HITSZ_GF]MDG2532149.1 glutathione S-transferase family protein [Sphingomonas sp. HITSZ_GF]